MASDHRNQLSAFALALPLCFAVTAAAGPAWADLDTAIAAVKAASRTKLRNEIERRFHRPKVTTRAIVSVPRPPSPLAALDDAQLLGPPI